MSAQLNVGLMKLSPIALARYALYIFVFATFIGMFVPMEPAMPISGLDSSWRQGLNVAVAEKLTFGKDLIFTSGPYSAIYTKNYHPATDLRTQLGSLYLALTYAGVLIFIFRKQVWIGLISTIVITGAFAWSRDAILLTYSFAALIAASQMAAETETRNTRKTLILLTLFLFPLGFLPLIKGSNLLGSGGTGAILLALFVASRWWKGAITLCAVGLISPMLFWGLTGQSLLDLPGYILSMIPISSGYSDAMVRYGPPLETRTYLLGTLITLVILFFSSKEPRLQKFTILAGFALTAFLGFKAGFVRHDGHSTISATLLLIISGFAIAVNSKRIFNIPVVYALLPVALFSSVLIISNHRSYNTTLITRNFTSKFTSTWTGLQQRLSNPDGLKTAYEERLAKLSEDAALPKLEGTSDLYNFEQYHLFASGNKWSPRPVFQSYSAYTPSLVRKNRDHLLGPRAPDNIFFRPRAIDGRLPNMLDGPSWPVILNRYEPVEVVSDYALLKKRKTPTDVVMKPLASGRYAFGEAVNIPATDKIVYAKISVSKSPFGKLRSFLYKPSRLRIFLRGPNDHVVRQNFIVPSMIKEGLIISPVVMSTDEFLQLYSPQAVKLSKQALTFTIEPYISNTTWSEKFKVEFFEFDVSPTNASEDLVAFHRPEAVPDEIEFKTTDACQTAIGLLDHERVYKGTTELKAKGLLDIQGWFVMGDLESGYAPAEMSAILTDANGQRTVLPLHRMNRGTMAKRFNNPKINEAGFRIEADISALNGIQSFQMGEKKGNVVTLCTDPGYTIERAN